MKTALSILCAGALLAGCAGKQEASAETAAPISAAPLSAVVTTADTSSDGLLDAGDFFTDRDLAQTADTENAVRYTLKDGQQLEITEEGVYVLTGTAKNATITVAADKEAKVQLVLEGLTVTNDDFPCIYVKSGDKVFVTTAADSALSVTGSFRADGDTNTDGVIFSRSDLVLNGTAALTISSTKNGVVCKDDLKLTGGSCTVTAAKKALEANDSIRAAGGSYVLNAGTDALHAENEDDDTLGFIYICGGSFTIVSGDDGVHGVSAVQIDGGTLDITAAEGIEAARIQLNGGEIAITASDDGINGAQKSDAYRPLVDITGGEITIAMGAGDTDGVDCNGDLSISGGTVDVTGSSAFDIDGTVSFTGGTVIINGQTVSTIPTQMMGGKGGMGRPGDWGGSGDPGSFGDPGGFGGKGRRW